MMIVKEFAQALNKVQGLVVDELRRQYPEQKWTIDSQVPEEILAKFQDLTIKGTSQPQQVPVANMPEAAITKASEAIQQASYKLTAADKETISAIQHDGNFKTTWFMSLKPSLVARLTW